MCRLQCLTLMSTNVFLPVCRQRSPRLCWLYAKPSVLGRPPSRQPLQASPSLLTARGPWICATPLWYRTVQPPSPHLPTLCPVPPPACHGTGTQPGHSYLHVLLLSLQCCGQRVQAPPRKHWRLPVHLSAARTQAAWYYWLAQHYTGQEGQLLCDCRLVLIWLLSPLPQAGVD